MKKVLLALVIGVNALSFAAEAQRRPGRPGHPGNPGHPGGHHNPLVQQAEQVRLEATRLHQVIVYGRFPFQIQQAAQQVVFEAGQLSQCVRFDGVGPGHRPGRQCNREVRQTERALNQLQRILGPLPFHNPVAQQLNRTQLALNRLGGYTPAPVNLVVQGQMNQHPFALQAPTPQQLDSLCIQFGRARGIFRVDSLLVNGRWFNIRGASLDQACRIVAQEAR